MQATKSPSSLVLGLALFSLFFGAGNMIYPLHVGSLLDDGWGASAIGFLFSAVIFPFFAVCILYTFRGNWEPILGSMGNRLRTPFLFLILTVWIPLGAGPRCITMVVGSLEMLGWEFSRGAISGYYSLLVMGIAWRRCQGLNWLGLILMPVLLLSLLGLVLRGMWLMGPLPEGAFHGDMGNAFFVGFLEGCHTMDLFAALFFSTAALPFLQQKYLALISLPQFIRGGLGALGVLGVVYLGLMILAVSFGGQLQLVPQEKALAFLATAFIGGSLGKVAVGAMLCACLTMSVALTFVYAKYVQTHVLSVFSWGSYRVALILTVVTCWLVSFLGFEGITWMSTPLLKGLYPLVLGLLALAVLRRGSALHESKGRV
jgi:LIVCS family branched-chain amino acid:cation transporter